MDNELDESNILEEEVTPEYSLMYGTDAGPRIFVLSNAEATTLLGVMLEETDDSFLVAIPSKLVHGPKGKESDHQVVPFIPVPYLRVFKSSLMTTMFLYGEYEDKYLAYLQEHGEEIYPELQDVMEAIRETLGEGGEELDEEDEEILELSLNTDSGVKEKAQGMTDDELRTYLKNKYKQGEVTDGTIKKH